MLPLSPLNNNKYISNKMVPAKNPMVPAEIYKLLMKPLKPGTMTESLQDRAQRHIDAIRTCLNRGMRKPEIKLMLDEYEKRNALALKIISELEKQSNADVLSLLKRDGQFESFVERTKRQSSLVKNKTGEISKIELEYRDRAFKQKSNQQEAAKNLYDVSGDDDDSSRKAMLLQMNENKQFIQSQAGNPDTSGDYKFAQSLQNKEYNSRTQFQSSTQFQPGAADTSGDYEFAQSLQNNWSRNSNSAKLSELKANYLKNIKNYAQCGDQELATISKMININIVVVNNGKVMMRPYKSPIQNKDTEDVYINYCDWGHYEPYEPANKKKISLEEGDLCPGRVLPVTSRKYSGDNNCLMQALDNASPTVGERFSSEELDLHNGTDVRHKTADQQRDLDLDFYAPDEDIPSQRINKKQTDLYELSKTDDNMIRINYKTSSGNEWESGEIYQDKQSGQFYRNGKIYASDDKGIYEITYNNNRIIEKKQTAKREPGSNRLNVSYNKIIKPAPKLDSNELFKSLRQWQQGVKSELKNIDEKYKNTTYANAGTNLKNMVEKFEKEIECLINNLRFDRSYNADLNDAMSLIKKIDDDLHNMPYPTHRDRSGNPGRGLAKHRLKVLILTALTITYPTRKQHIYEKYEALSPLYLEHVLKATENNILSHNQQWKA